MGSDREKDGAEIAAAMLLLFLAGPPARGDEPATVAPPEGYVCHRLAGPITIDGKLDDRAWRDVPWTADFVDIEGGVRPRPRFRTRAKMAWDDRSFYVAAEMEEPEREGVVGAAEAEELRHAPLAR